MGYPSTHEPLLGALKKADKHLVAVRVIFQNLLDNQTAPSFNDELVDLRDRVEIMRVLMIPLIHTALRE